MTVPAGGTATWTSTARRSTSRGHAPANGAGLSFREVAGLITFTPASARTTTTSRSACRTTSCRGRCRRRRRRSRKFNASQTVGNRHAHEQDGAIAGDADFYAWGLEDKKDKGKASNDLRAVGVQSFAAGTATDPNRQQLVFAVNTHDRWSNAAATEFDIYVDVNNDGTTTTSSSASTRARSRPARSTASWARSCSAPGVPGRQRSRSSPRLRRRSTILMSRCPARQLLPGG